MEIEELSSSSFDAGVKIPYPLSYFYTTQLCWIIVLYYTSALGILWALISYTMHFFLLFPPVIVEEIDNLEFSFLKDYNMTPEGSVPLSSFSFCY